MTSSREISDLFARLAFWLQTIGHGENEEGEEESSTLDISISELNRSLNLGEDSRVRVLDAALSLMCFKAPQVFDSTIESLVKTIVCVLSSSISCKVSRFQNEETLQVGSSIPSQNSMELIELSNDIIGKLGGNGTLARLLLQAVVRLAASTPRYQNLFPSEPIFDAKPMDGRTSSVSKLLVHFPTELPIESRGIPMRLLFWYLDPLSLKDDVSKILQDTLERPFLCLNKELYRRVDWREIVTCLVLSPSMFIETRALIHKWFLLTGLASVLEFLVSLVSVFTDMVSRPTWWGIPVELASTLPFSNAYFPCKHQSLRILSGPLSSEALVLLVGAVRKPVMHTRECLDPSSEPAPIKIQAIDHKSEWALAINFSDWFYFACATLFSEGTLKKKLLSKCTLEVPNNWQVHDVEPLFTIAARYIAWILSPVSKSVQDSLLNCLIKVSEAWTLKQFGLQTDFKDISIGKRKKPKRLGFGNTEGYSFNKEYDSRMLELWLREFQNRINVLFNGSETRGANNSWGFSLQKGSMIRRVPLGILIGTPSCVTEHGCELLLHYAATGKILHLKKTKKVGYVMQNSEDEISKKEALAGACLVFSLTDVLESISASIFEGEEDELEFINQVKLKSCKYLVKCINRLTQLHTEEDGDLMPKDLSSRLVQWRNQGQELSQVNKDLEDVTISLSRKLSSR